MNIEPNKIAKIIDISLLKTYNTEEDIRLLINAVQ